MKVYRTTLWVRDGDKEGRIWSRLSTSTTQYAGTVSNYTGSRYRITLEVAEIDESAFEMIRERAA